MVPMIVPPVVGALVFSWMFRDDLGLYDWLLGRVGLNVGWFSEPGPARLMLVLEDVWHQAVFAALVLLAGLQGLPKEPLEAAQLDGASWAQQQRYVVLPALRGLIVFVTIMSVMDGFRVFDAISVITKGGPGGATESLMIYTFDVAIGQQRLGLGSAVGVLTVLGILLMLFPFLRNTVREVRGR
jgi:ABC-type sugar transport system permease subunit